MNNGFSLQFKVKDKMASTGNAGNAGRDGKYHMYCTESFLIAIVCNYIFIVYSTTCVVFNNTSKDLLWTQVQVKDKHDKIYI